MTGIDFLQMINDIDDDLLEDASKAQKKNIPSWTKWAAAAASFFILFGLGFMASRLVPMESDHTNQVVAFCLNGRNYEAFGMEDYISYGLLSEAAEARAAIQAPMVTKEDLGSKIGNIEVMIGGKRIECNVYYYNACPDDNDVCIVEFPKEEYRLFISKEK